MFRTWAPATHTGESGGIPAHLNPWTVAIRTLSLSPHLQRGHHHHHRSLGPHLASELLRGVWMAMPLQTLTAPHCKFHLGKKRKGRGDHSSAHSKGNLGLPRSPVRKQGQPQAKPGEPQIHTCICRNSPPFQCVVGS